MHTINPWQQNNWQYLIARHENNTLPHSLLLTGEAGSGKTNFALALAEFLLCEQPQGSIPCGQCRTCKFLTAGVHPDLKHVQPEDGSKVIKIEQIRAVIDMLAKTAHQNNSYQIVIIDPANLLNIASSNAILKTLEEPAGKVLLMLLTAHPAMLLPTIRSRCQKIAFYKPAEEHSGQAGDELFKDCKALAQKNLAPLDFAAKYQNDDLSATLTRLQQWTAKVIKYKVERANSPELLNKWFNLLDQLIEYKKHNSNNLSAQLTLEELAIEIAHAS